MKAINIAYGRRLSAAMLGMLQLGWMTTWAIGQTGLTSQTDAPVEVPIPEVKEQDKLPPNEDYWLTSGVCRDVAQMLVFAAAKQDGNIGRTPPEVVIGNYSINGLTRDFAVLIKESNGRTVADKITSKDSPWEPSVYLPWAKAYIEAAKLQPAAAPAGTLRPEAHIEQLTNPTLKNFLKTNMELSALLTQYPADPALHEQSALLLLAVAWSESAGTFTDIRGILNAATAHLVVADALRKQPSENQVRKLADLTLLVLTGREAEADQQLAAATADQKAGSPAGQWLESLRLANDGDWRKSTPTKESSFVLRRTYYWSLCRHVGTMAGLQFLRKAEPGEEPDWARIAFARGTTVEAGNVFLEAGLAGEGEEIKLLIEAFRPYLLSSRDPSAVPQTLDEIYMGPWVDDRLEVAPIGLWTERAQRHLLMTVTSGYDHLQNKLGVSSSALEYRNATRSLTDKLRLAPFLNLYTASSVSEYNSAMAAAAALTRDHPQWVSASNWYWAQEAQRRRAAPESLPLANHWFYPGMPVNTALEPRSRLLFRDLNLLDDGGFITHIRELAPHNPDVCYGALLAHLNPDPPELVREVYGPLLEYNLTAAMAYASAVKDDPDAYEAAMRAVCGLDPNYYLVLGQYFLDHGDAGAAANAYQKAADLAPDRVSVSNNVQFLADYYFDHDQREKAFAVARMAAEVYSSRGLATLMRLNLRAGNFTEALKDAQQIQERYNEPQAVFMVYLEWSQKTTDPEEKRTAEKVIARTFPDGVQPAKYDGFEQTPNPAEGVRITSNGPTLAENRLRFGDVIVAVNDYRVRNIAQYKAITYMAYSKYFDFIVLRDGNYLKVTVVLPYNNLGVEMANNP